MGSPLPIDREPTIEFIIDQSLEPCELGPPDRFPKEVGELVRRQVIDLRVAEDRAQQLDSAGTLAAEADPLHEKVMPGLYRVRPLTKLRPTRAGLCRVVGTRTRVVLAVR